MDFKQIKELIKLVNETDLHEVSIEKDGVAVSIKNKRLGEGVAPVVVAQPTPVAPAVVQNTVAPPPAAVSTPEPAAEEPVTNDKLTTIKSPMIGTFYRSSSPDKPPFVKVGDTVDVGSVLCIVEAMKLFNEIESEISGKIVKVLVDDATPVEYDQDLFLVELQ